MNTTSAEFCLHQLRSSAASPFVLRCDCGTVVQYLCAVCRLAVRHAPTEESCEAAAVRCASCEALLCHACVLDCQRLENAAQCPPCHVARRFSFSPRNWCVVVRLFFSDGGLLRVEQHIMQTLFGSLGAAVEACKTLLVVAYGALRADVTRELVAALDQFTGLAAADEAATLQVLRTTPNVFGRNGDSARLEFHAKLLVLDAGSTPFPTQLNNINTNNSSSSVLLKFE